MPQDNTLDIKKSLKFDEVLHQIVRRRRDCSWWYVRFHKGLHNWVPCQVDNQSGKQLDAERRFWEATN